MASERGKSENLAMLQKMQRYEDALEEIATKDSLDLIADPEWAARKAHEALNPEDAA